MALSTSRPTRNSLLHHIRPFVSWLVSGRFLLSSSWCFITSYPLLLFFALEILPLIELSLLPLLPRKSCLTSVYCTSLFHVLSVVALSHCNATYLSVYPNTRLHIKSANYALSIFIFPVYNTWHPASAQ